MEMMVRGRLRDAPSRICSPEGVRGKKRKAALTSPRSSPAPSSSPRSARPPLRSAAGPCSRSGRWRRRHPACDSPEESDPPFPGSPSSRLHRGEASDLLPLVSRGLGGGSCLVSLLLGPLPHGLRPLLLFLLAVSDHLGHGRSSPLSTAGRRRRVISCVFLRREPLQFPTHTARWRRCRHCAAGAVPVSSRSRFLRLGSC